MRLTAENVEKVVRECLYTDMEIKNWRESEHEVKQEDLITPPGALVVRGIRSLFGFNPERILKNKENIKSMLSELPDEFRSGWSFLNACVTKTGVQWGEHANIEVLMCLGEAAGFVSYPLPRDMWQVLPGGMPYFKLDID